MSDESTKVLYKFNEKGGLSSITKQKLKPKMQKLGSTLSDLVKLKRQDVDVTESRETNNRS